MGHIAEKNADIAIVTSDNPRSEPPDEIIEDICQGMSEPIRVIDRKQAICQALEYAQPNDVILIAGKGHEDYQEIKGKRIPFEDRAVVRELYKEAHIDSEC